MRHSALGNSHPKFYSLIISEWFYQAALALLPVLLLICWGICGWHMVKNSSS
jgi:hypothetical protein